jgi:hypothetical protein
MKSFRRLLTAAGLAALVSITGIAAASDPQGEALVESVEVTAVVASIDHHTRAVTLRADDGEEYSFIAGDDVRNLAQVNVGDVVTATYIEAVAWEVHQGGQADVGEGLAVARAELGAMPAGAVVHEVVLTVEIIEIDRETPTVTFRGPQGNTRTIMVKRPEKLTGVSVGDTVDIIFTEAFAIRVDPAQ